MALPYLLTIAVLLLPAQQAAAAGQPAQPGLSSGSRPLTCACTRELRPVCGSDGRAYDNSCLARCAGVQITDPKPQDPRNCNRIAILPPGPAGQNPAGTTITSSSSSNAVSSGGSRLGRRLLRVLSQQARQPGGFGASICACPRIYVPVCGSDGRAYNTKCEAECVGVTVTGQRPVNGVCNSGPLGPINPSGPGFNPSGPIGTRPWWQGQPWPNPLPESGPRTGPLPGPGVGPGSRPGCACALLLSPVCGVDGKTYSNSCVARCNGVAIAAQGNCPGGG